MKPEVKVFTRDNPCTKLHIWNCFRGVRGFKKVDVAHAQSIIGVNAPRNMLSKGYATITETAGVEYYQLTKYGTEWLMTGLKSYLKNHPNDVKKAKNTPRGF